MRRAVTVLAMAAIAGCGGRGPSVLPIPTPTIPNPPAVACPADLTGEAHVGKLPILSFDTPSPQDGQPPVTVACTPASGSEFPVGATTVTCEAVDALGRKAACHFDVVVTDIPRIERTRFMAFGDSLTEGKVATLIGTDATTPFNYEDIVKMKLAARYELQTITMVDEPRSSEPTGEGKWRFGPAFDQARPEAVLLLEGTNDLIAAQDEPAIVSAVDALRNMIVYARGRGALTFIATLPPMNGQLFNLRDAAAGVPVLNDRIRQMAQAESAILVDLEKAIPLSLIGPDGKHPTPQGYQKIADTFYDAIVARLEVKQSAPTKTSGLAPEHR